MIAASPLPAITLWMETLRPRVLPVEGAVNAARLPISAGVNIARQAQAGTVAAVSPGY